MASVLHDVYVEEKYEIFLKFSVYGVSADYTLIGGDIYKFLLGNSDFISIE